MTPARSPIGTVITVLVLLGIFCSWLDAVALVERSGAERDADGFLVMTEAKTALYYAAHALGIVSVTVAGVLAAVKNRLAAFGFGTRLWLSILLVTTTAWALAAYGPVGLLSPAVFDATGPFVWWTVILVAAGAEEMLWPYLDRLLRGLSFATAALAVLAMATAGEYAYYRGFSKYLQYAALLTWLGGWTLLTSAAARGWRLAWNALPYAVLIVTALYAQGRSWLANALLLGAGFAVLRARELHSGREAFRIVVIACVLLAVCACVVYFGWPPSLRTAFDGLGDRLTDDTRSGQYEDFFASVPVTDLILGRGPRGTWYWVGFGNFQFFDNGYLWTLFIGGIPTLVSYAGVVLTPWWRAFSPGGKRDDAAAAALVLLWAIALTGLSTFILPSLTLPGYVVLLFAGRCHLANAERGVCATWNSAA